RRIALLVAEDNRPALSRDVGANSSPTNLCRLQSHLLPAVHPGLSRHAAALLHLPAGMAVVECAVLRRRLDPCRRLHPAARLSRLVAVARRAGGPPSMARHGW